MASRGVSPARRRVTNLLAVLVLAVLAVSVWQTWDFWREAAGFADRRAARQGRRFYPPGGYYGRGPLSEPDADMLDWELRDRVIAALELNDEAEWERIEPKVKAVVRLQEQLPESKDLFSGGASPRPPAAAQPATDEVAAVRDERARLRLQLKQARDELRKSVSRRQEAALVLLGLLD
jgi:hypothetical protein